MKIWVILLTLVFVGCSTATQSIRKIAAASDPTEVLVSFVGANFNLNGTLTYPGQSSAFRRSPAVLLIPGSGPTDRDGNQPGLTTDLLKQISTDLARKGIASLRFDKRSVNSYSNLWPKDPNALTEFFSWENFLEDASQAYLILKNSKGIDPDQCSILGHSEGGLIASQIAARLNPPSLVLMATSGRPLGEVLQTQVQTLLAKQNASASVRAFYESEDVRIQKSIEASGIIPPNVPLGLQAIFPQSAAKYLQSVLQLQPEVKLMAYKGEVTVFKKSS